MSLIEPQTPPARLPGTQRGAGEDPGTPEPRKSYLEMRLHPRLHASLSVTYQVSLPESATSLDGAGTLKNLSFGGVYFTSNDSLPLEPGQIRNFSLYPATSGANLRRPSCLSARGLVVRVERPAPNSATFGIAIKFLTPLQLSPA